MNKKSDIIKIRQLLRQTIDFLEKESSNEKYGNVDDNKKHLLFIKKEAKVFFSILETQINSTKNRKGIDDSPNKEIIEFIKEVKKEFIVKK